MVGKCVVDWLLAEVSVQALVGFTNSGSLRRLTLKQPFDRSALIILVWVSVWICSPSTTPLAWTGPTQELSQTDGHPSD